MPDAATLEDWTTAWPEPRCANRKPKKRRTQAAAEEPEAQETPAEGQDSPVLDLTDAAVKRLIRTAKQRGYVTLDELNAVLPSDETSPPSRSKTSWRCSTTWASPSSRARKRPRRRRQGRKPKRPSPPRTCRIKVEAEKAPADRTDDPVRMYLREMGQVELLSREGEIAIAKRIEAGREAMIQGLCESPLTFQAIIIWRDELNEAKILLRDIIDLEATYAGPDAKNAAARRCRMRSSPSRRSPSRSRSPSRAAKSAARRRAAPRR